MEQPKKSLLEALQGAAESDRILAAADVLFHAESYSRALTLAIRGLAQRLTESPEGYREAYSVVTLAEDFAAWIEGHHKPLYAAVPPVVVAGPTVEAKTVDGATVH